LALGVCYQACLKNREEFRKMIFDYFEDPFTLLDENQLETEFTRYLLVFRMKADLSDIIYQEACMTIMIYFRFFKQFRIKLLLVAHLPVVNWCYLSITKIALY
jgi:hypothetical protein